VPEGRIVDLVLPDTAHLVVQEIPDLLNGITVIRGSGFSAQRTLAGDVISAGTKDFTAIPYYAWAHRGKAQMTVWPSRHLGAARPVPAPTLARRSAVSASSRVNSDALNDQLEPESSSDQSVPFAHWWPKKGTTEWAQYDFEEPGTVSSVAVYWFDDSGSGECRIPRTWRVLYKEGDHWSPVSGPSSFPVEKDRETVVRFNEVRTSALRLEFTSQDEFSAGLYEWRVE
jgi:hypothetical protein